MEHIAVLKLQKFWVRPKDAIWRQHAPTGANWRQQAKMRPQGAATTFHLPKKFSDTKTCIFWCKTTWGTTFTKGVLPLVGESR